MRLQLDYKKPWREMRKRKFQIFDFYGLTVGANALQVKNPIWYKATIFAKSKNTPYLSIIKLTVGLVTIQNKSVYDYN